VNSVGIVTARDSLTIQWTDQQVWQTITQFLQLQPDEARRDFNLRKDANDWKVTLAQKDVNQSGPTRKNITPILYRPFDIRSTYYTGNSRGFHCRPRGEVMRHMLQENVALVTARRNRLQEIDSFFCSEHIVEAKCGESTIQSYTFPLYLYPDAEKLDLLSELDPSNRVPNLTPNLVQALKIAYGRKPSPENIFHYIYGILYANAYRQKYAEFLKTDFPRIPFTSNRELFKQVAKFGVQLVDLHLLKSRQLNKPVSKCQGSENMEVVKPIYEQANKRVKFNPDTWFDGVIPEVWEYRIGGYQVLHKWLKDRKGRSLTSEEVVTYTRIVTAITETIEIQASLDDLYKAVESSLLEISL